MTDISTMKAVILAGGLGTRISEETAVKPKPMIEIGGRPIIWHIMKIYAHYGVNEFVILCGYKGHLLKDFFVNYFLHTSDVTVDLQSNDVQIHDGGREPWKVTLLQTGDATETGGRLKRATQYLKEEELFFLTYGDGVADIDVRQLLKHHQEHKRMATLTAVQPPARFGAVDLSGERVLGFREKPRGESLINGGFFVMSPECLDYIDGDKSILEVDVLPKLVAKEELSAFQHAGFWRPMDTLRDKAYLDQAWDKGEAPWKLW